MADHTALLLANLVVNVLALVFGVLRWRQGRQTTWIVGRWR